MTALWSPAELKGAFGVAPSAPLSAAVEGVSIDSRTLESGDLFIAIKGAALDGHDHVARAFESGADRFHDCDLRHRRGSHYAGQCGWCYRRRLSAEAGSSG